jgi:hypothetical protein
MSEKHGLGNALQNTQVKNKWRNMVKIVMVDWFWGVCSLCAWIPSRMARATAVCEAFQLGTRRNRDE